MLEAREQHCEASGRGGCETEELRGLSCGEGWIGTLRGCAGGPGVRRLGPTPVSAPAAGGGAQPAGPSTALTPAPGSDFTLFQRTR